MSTTFAEVDLSQDDLASEPDAADRSHDDLASELAEVDVVSHLATCRHRRTLQWSSMLTRHRCAYVAITSRWRRTTHLPSLLCLLYFALPAATALQNGLGLVRVHFIRMEHVCTTVDL